LKKKFVTNLAFLLFLNILIKPFYIFGIDRTVQNIVGAEAYGTYFRLLSVALILQILLDMGIELFNKREIARHNQLLGKFLSNIIALRLLLGILYFIVCIIIGLFLGYTKEQYKLFIILLGNQFIACFILYMRSNLGGLLMFKTDSIISILDKTLLIIICSVLLWCKFINAPFQIEWFVYAQSAAYIATFVISFVIVLRKSAFFRIRFDRKYYISILRQSFPYSVLVLLMAFYLRINPEMLGSLLYDGNTQSGIYAHSFRILDILANYGYLFSIILLPLFSKMLKQGERVEQLVQLSFLLLVIPSLILTISSMFYGKELISLLYYEHIAISAKVFVILIPGFVGMTFTYIFGALLTANGNLKALILMAAVGVILNLTLSFILIPRFEVIGAAIANLTTQIYAGATQLFISIRIFKFKVNYSLIIKIIILIISVCLTGIFIKDNITDWLVGYISLLVISLLMAAFLKLLNPQDIYQILRYEEEI
jgi:O-antigen/teichoic acid export membrane protein